jgi:hypothetical protein
MQAALRVAAGEVARGLSTGLIVWAGGGQCPACTCAPTLTCPELPRAADCVCHGGHRVVECEASGWGSAALLVALLIGAGLGVVLSVVTGSLLAERYRSVPSPAVSHDGGPSSGAVGVRPVRGPRGARVASTPPVGGVGEVFGD